MENKKPSRREQMLRSVSLSSGLPIGQSAHRRYRSPEALSSSKTLKRYLNEKRRHHSIDRVSPHSHHASKTRGLLTFSSPTKKKKTTKKISNLSHPQGFLRKLEPTQCPTRLSATSKKSFTSSSSKPKSQFHKQSMLQATTKKKKSPSKISKLAKPRPSRKHHNQVAAIVASMSIMPAAYDDKLPLLASDEGRANHETPPCSNIIINCQPRRATQTDIHKLNVTYVDDRPRNSQGDATLGSLVNKSGDQRREPTVPPSSDSKINQSCLTSEALESDDSLPSKTQAQHLQIQPDQVMPGFKKSNTMSLRKKQAKPIEDSEFFLDDESLIKRTSLNATAEKQPQPVLTKKLPPLDHLKKTSSLNVCDLKRPVQVPPKIKDSLYEINGSRGACCSHLQHARSTFNMDLTSHQSNEGLCLKAQQLNMARLHYKGECQELKHALSNTKRFLNMVIHDCRNPTNQISYSIGEALDKLTLSREKMSQFHTDFLREECIKDQTCERLRVLIANYEQLHRQHDDIKGQLKDTKDKVDQLNSQLREKDQTISELLIGQSSFENQLKDAKDKMAVLINHVGFNEEDVQTLLSKSELDREMALLRLSEGQARKVLDTIMQNQDHKEQVREYIAVLEKRRIHLMQENLQMQQMILQHKIDLIQAGLHPPSNHLQPAQTLTTTTLEKIQNPDKLGKFGSMQGEAFKLVKVDTMMSDMNVKCSNDSARGYPSQLYDQTMHSQKPFFHQHSQSLSKQKSSSNNISSFHFRRRTFFPTAELLPLSQEDQIIALTIACPKPIDSGPTTPPVRRREIPRNNAQSNLSLKQFRFDTFTSQSVSMMLAPVPVDMPVETAKEDLLNLIKVWDEAIQRQKCLCNNIKMIQEECQDMVETCKHSTIMLLNQINDLLDLAKMQTMKFQLNKSYFNLIDLIQNSFKIMEFVSKKKRIQTRLEVPDDYKPYFSQIYGDQNRFEQIMLNFISNSLKFTNREGTVEVRLFIKSIERAKKKNSHQAPENPSRKIKKLLKLVESESSDTDMASLAYSTFVIQIVDDGRGISKEGIDNLFIDFSSLKEHKADNERGTGLGLSICKLFIDLMSGSVKVESEGQGKGTVFSIELTTLCKVDHIDETLFSLMSNSSIASISSSQVGSASNQSEKRSKNAKSFVKSSFLRPMVTASSHISSSSSEVSPTNFRKSGIIEVGALSSVENDTQLVPMNISRQIDELESSLEDEASEAERTPNMSVSIPPEPVSEAVEHDLPRLKFPSLEEAAPNPVSQLRVLVVNDEILSCLILEKMLVDKIKVGHVDKAYNGEEAREMATSNFYHIILMDLNMPVTDGYQSTEQIRQFFARSNQLFMGGLGYYNGEDFSPKHGEPMISRHPFIVAVTASEITPEEEERCFESGFDTCFSAPLSVKVLKEEIVGRVVSLLGMA